MAFVVNDRVKETTTSTGTGTINLAGAETGFETFVAGIGNSNTTYYCIQAQGGSAFEIGVGTVTDASPDTLSRTTIISSSNSDSAVDFGAGTKDVFCTLPASKAVIEDNSTNADIAGNLTVGGTVDGVDIAARDAVLTSTTTTANAALPKAGGTMSGNLVLSGANITMSGSETVDGVDVSARDSVLTSTTTTANAALPKAGGTMTGDLILGDNIKIEVGDATGGDLEIFHDTTNSNIVNNTGALKLRSDNYTIRSADDATNSILANPSGAVTLHHNGTAKFATTSGGFDGSGDTFTFTTGGTEFGRIENDSNDMYIRSMVQDKDIQFRGNDGGSEITALTLDMSAAGALVVGSDVKLPDNGKVIFGAGSDLQIYHNSSNNVSFIEESGASALHIRGGDIVLKSQTDNDDYIKCIEDGAVELYHNNTKMASTTSAGFRVEDDRRLEIANGSNWSGELAGKIEHHSASMYIQYTTSFITRNASGSNTLTIDSSGNATFGGNVTAFSDIRLKDNIQTIDNALDKVCKLRGVEYTRKQTGAREIGVIANEVKEVVPELVTVTDLRSDINPDELNDVHVMNYQNTVGLLIEAIKDLKAEIEELKKAK